ncbi:MAG: hypothetical protein ACRD36_03800, partial [Candidatus Acidiferrum sp.]
PQAGVRQGGAGEEAGFSRSLLIVPALTSTGDMAASFTFAAVLILGLVAPLMGLPSIPQPTGSILSTRGGFVTWATGTTMSVIDRNVSNGTRNQIIRNIQISNDPNLGSNFPVVNAKTNKIYVYLSTICSYSLSTQ